MRRGAIDNDVRGILMNKPDSSDSPQYGLARSWNERHAYRIGRGVVAVVAIALGSAATAAQPVLQRGYNPSVTGANLNEAILNTTNVAPSTFGLVFKLPVVGSMYAQPLYVPGVVTAKRGTHNVVYVATMSDMLYAFDADTAGAALWRVNL